MHKTMSINGNPENRKDLNVLIKLTLAESVKKMNIYIDPSEYFFKKELHPH